MLRYKIFLLTVIIILFICGCMGEKKENITATPEPAGSPVETPETVSTQATHKGDPFVISLNTWIGYAPFYLAKEKGFFEDLNVKFVVTDDVEAQRQSFKSGEYNTISETVDSFANGAPSGVKGKAVLKVDDSYGGDGIVAKKDIKMINNLKGKTIAFAQGQPSHYFLIYLLNIAGLSSKDIKPKYEDPDIAAQSFEKGEVDAAVTWEPYLTQAADKKGKILITSKEAEGLIVDVTVVSDNTINKRPDDVQKMVQGWFRAVEFLKLHRKEATKIMLDGMNKEMPEESKMTYEDFQDMLKGIKFADLSENKAYFGKDTKSSTFVEVFNTAGNIWQQEGLISEPKDGKDLYTTKFIEEINQEKIVAQVKNISSEQVKPASSNTEIPPKATATSKPAKKPTVKPSKPSGQDIVQLDVPPIYFESGSSQINRNSYFTIDKVAGTLLHFKNLYVRIEGHTDDVGEEQSNQLLSKERAQSVANYIIKHYPKINKKRIIVKGYGEAKPIASNNTEEGKELNRRTEFYIMK